MRIKLAIFVGTCIALLALTQTAFPQSATAKKIDDLLQPISRDGRFSGIVIASQNGSIIYEKAFGLANAELKVPNTVGSRIAIVVDGRIMSAPTVQTPIASGILVVTSGLTEREARSLASRLDPG